MDYVVRAVAPSAAPPTLATVARAAGVSRQTVSNALNNPELLRPDTLVRVQGVIERLGYSPNRAARQLRTRASHLIGLRLGPAHEGASSGSMDRFVNALVEECSRSGHQVLLFAGDPDDPLDGYDTLLRSTAVDAFVVTDTYAGSPQPAFLQERQAPFVAFGRPWEDPDADHAWVDVDGAAGTRAAVEHLLAQGHDRVAWLGWDHSRIGEDRRSGWATAMSGEVSGLERRSADHVDAARLAAHGLLEDPSITAIACASDLLGIGVLRACAERGLRPGADIGVVGYDDSPAAHLAWPELSSVRQPLEQVAVELVRLLRQVLTHEPMRRERGLMLPPELVPRASSSRLGV